MIIFVFFMVDFREDEEEVLKLGRGKYNRYSTPIWNRAKVSKYDLNSFFLNSEDSVVVQEDFYD